VEIAVEHERKLDANAGFELPDLGGEPLEPRVFTSVYYDTDDRSLTRSGITLRRRTERGKSVWQLKLPSADARLELEEPGGPAEPPAELSRLLYAHLRHGKVAPVAELRTRRHGSLVERRGATAEVTVDEVAIMDALRVADGFVEVEIELRSGNPKRLDDIAEEIEEAGARLGDGRPKVFRALGIASESSSRPDDAFEVLRGLVRKQLRLVLAHDPGTRLGTDPESLHDMRVAVRRSRALLHAGRKLIQSDVRGLEEELKWLGGELGAVRDLDVLLERLRSSAAELGPPDAAAAKRLLRKLDQQRTRARRALLRSLDGPRYVTLLDRFDSELDALRPSMDGGDLDALAQKQLKKLHESAAALDDEPADEELHALRKRGKRVRYAFELGGDDKVVARAKRLQDVLGDHQDSVVAESALRTLAAEAGAAEAVAAGQLLCAERERRSEARASWRKALRRLERAAT